MTICDVCGDAWKARGIPRETARQEAKKVYDQTKIPQAIYQESGEWTFIAAAEAFKNNYPVREIIC